MSGPASAASVATTSFSSADILYIILWLRLCIWDKPISDAITIGCMPKSEYSYARPFRR